MSAKACGLCRCFRYVCKSFCTSSECVLLFFAIFRSFSICNFFCPLLLFSVLPFCDRFEIGTWLWRLPFVMNRGQYTYTRLHFDLEWRALHELWRVKMITSIIAFIGCVANLWAYKLWADDVRISWDANPFWLTYQLADYFLRLWISGSWIRRNWLEIFIVLAQRFKLIAS